MRVLIGLMFLLCALPASAQVYQWDDADTGARRLSNIAPAWYRKPDGKPFPRVRVFDNGRLIDDTGLSAEQRLELRANSPLARYLPPLNLPQGNAPGRRSG